MTDTNEEIFNLQQAYLEAEIAQDQAKVKEIEEKINQVLDKTPGGGYNTETTEVSDSSQPPANSTEIPEGSTEQVEAKAGEEAATHVPNSEVAEEKEAVKDKEVQSSATENWIESLDPKIRENVERLLKDNQQLVHRIKSDDGRVRALNSHLENTRKEAAKYKEELEKLQKAPPQSQSKTPAAQSPYLLKLKDEDEGLYNAVTSETEALKDQIRKLEEKLDSSVKPLQTTQEKFVQEREHEYLQRELDILCQYEPMALEILNHPAWERFYREAPPGVKALADSYDHRDLLEAFRIYGGWAQELNRLSEQYAGTNITVSNQNTVQAKPNQPDPRAAAVEAERKRKLDATPVASQAVKPPVTKKPTEAEIFSNPELLLKEQQRIMEEEMKKLGLR